MEGRRSARAESPVYVRQKSVASSAGGLASSPVMSPVHRHVRSGSAGMANFRRNQNSAARAAAQRLARVMAHQPAEEDDDEDEDDEDDEDSGIPLVNPFDIGSRQRRPAGRSASPALGRYPVEQTPAVHSTSAGRPSSVAKSAILIPPIKPVLLPRITTVPSEPEGDHQRETRLPFDLGHSNMRETVHQRASSALQDEIDMLQEENENFLEKLRLAEERREEAEARIKQLEKQVSSLGEGVSLEACLLRRKEEALQQREAALKAAAQTTNARNEAIAALRMEAETAREEARSAIEQLQEADFDVKSLKTVTQRMILSQEEMEEVVLKRCWLARYWKLCVQFGIHSEIAETRHEYWSSLAPLPVEVVLSAGEKAREESSPGNTGSEERGLNDLSGEKNIENMLLVEKGLRELASLKVEDAVLLAMSQQRRPTIKSGQLIAGSTILDLKSTTESQNLVETLELTQDESEDVVFKQAWLTYFWRRAKNHGLEEDIADERLQFWINQNAQSPTIYDALTVERGLVELKKLSIETQLWEASRKETHQNFIVVKSQIDSEP